MFIYLSILLFPLISSLLVGFAGKYFNKLNVSIISVSCMGICLFCSLIAFYQVALLRAPYFFNLLPWIHSGLFLVDWDFRFDVLTVVMLLVVNIVSFLVHLYSINYMGEDPHLFRFLSYISLFTFFMIILVTANNFVQLFLGWEGVGLCSFLLISFWFSRIQAIKSALKAFIMNRIGDLGLTLGIILVFKVSCSLDFETIFSLAPYLINKKIVFCTFTFNILNIICFLLFIGAIGKSAQVGLHLWLPDAMEGPTPVSALIHAATMVTAGVFLIIRCSHIFEYAPKVLIYMTFFGSITSFFSATVGLTQTDIKKVIAYSTCSQLGYMIFICGLSKYTLSLYHLGNHAFFKALLFLSAGSIIHAVNDEQNMYKLGGLRTQLPFIYSVMVLGSLALGGLPFLSGFYSKDLILEIIYLSHCFNFNGFFSFIFGITSACFTGIYSVRLLENTFFYQTKLPYKVISNIHETTFSMWVPLTILSIGSVFSGYLGSDVFISFGSDFMNNAIFSLPGNFKLIEAEFLPVYIKILPLILTCLSLMVYMYISLSYKYLYLYVIKNKNIFVFKLYAFLNKKWYFDKIYNNIISIELLNFFISFFYLIDKSILEYFGPKSITTNLYNNSILISKSQTGLTSNYLYVMNFVITILLSSYYFVTVFFQ